MTAEHILTVKTGLLHMAVPPHDTQQQSSRLGRRVLTRRHHWRRRRHNDRLSPLSPAARYHPHDRTDRFLDRHTLIATAPPEQTYWAQTFVCMLIITFGMDMSFPAGTVIVSNALPKEQQGIGASLVNTVVNYSISLALGFAGTVESHVEDGDQLRGYRGALYVGMGLASLGLCTSAVFLARGIWIDRIIARRSDSGEKQVDER